MPENLNKKRIVWSSSQIFVFVILAISVFFRVWKLGNIPGINGDEAWYGNNALLFLHHQPYPTKTPTGNPLNWLFFGPTVLLNAIFPPSIALLRVTSAASGIITLALNFWLCRRVYGRLTAIISTLLLAVLPMAIMESRYGWDPSQSIGACLSAMYLALLSRTEPTSPSPRSSHQNENERPSPAQGRGFKRVLRLIGSPRPAAGEGLGVRGHAVVLTSLQWLTLSFIVTGLAMWVHPTNVFIAPIPLLAAAIMLKSRVSRWSLRTLMTVGGIVAMIVLGVITLTAHYWANLPSKVEWGRLLSPFGELPFALYCMREFSGILDFRGISGACYVPWRHLGGQRINPGWWDWATACVFIACAIIIFKSRVATQSRFLLAGLAIGLSLFDVAMQRNLLAASYGRYGLWMIAPGIVLIADVITQGLQQKSPCRIATQSALTVICVGLLFSVYWNYFRVFERTGGVGPDIFRTAAIDPKEQALRSVQSHHEPGQHVMIATDDWWMYLPLHYLAGNDSSIDVVTITDQEIDNKTWTRAFADGQLWFVEFAGTARVQNIQTSITEARILGTQQTITDYADRPTITILHRP